MGDNTLNSLDSRFWGDFSSSYVIGKSFFVYWPLTKRFGVGQSVTAQ
jgi:signal peptidase I